MNILVAYDSYFINTLKVAGTVATAFEQSGAKVSFERIYQVDFSNLADIDLLAMAAPTHNQGMPRPIKSVLKKLPKGTLEGKQVLTFDTRYKMPARKSGSAAQKMLRLLERLGGQAFAPTESFFVQERRGPLYPGEIERAAEWATVLMEKKSIPV